MIWALLSVLAGVEVFSVASLFNLRDAVQLADKLRRNDARLAAERWEVLQERHDAIIELIAQIAEAKAPTPDLDDRTRRRPRKKAKT